MANPNIVNVSSIYGKVSGNALTTSAQTIINNPSSSGKIVKVNSLIVSNINGTSAADVTAYLLKNGSTTLYIAYTISVPADATLVVISKDTSMYLEENDSILALASTNSYLHAVVSSEDIS